MSLKKIFIAGFGGQGVMMIGEMITWAAMQEGKEVTWMPSYGPAMRGGTANCTVCVSDDKPITSPVASKCDILVVMNEPSLLAFQDMLYPGGQLFINASMVPEDLPVRDDVVVHRIDTEKLALETAGIAKAANMVMLGAILKESGVASRETMDGALSHFFSGAKAKFIPGNEKALYAWEE